MKKRTTKVTTDPIKLPRLANKITKVNKALVNTDQVMQEGAQRVDNKCKGLLAILHLHL